MTDARATALKVLEDVTKDGAFLNLSLKKRLPGLGEQDRRFCTRLITVTLENLIRIDYVIDAFTEGKRIHRQIRDILRIGVCQLMYFDSVPKSAAVNESVKLCAASPKRQLKGFVNAVMHSIADGLDTLKYPPRGTDEAKYLSVIYSYPEWLVKKYIADYGADFTEAMLSYDREPLTCVRINGLKVSKKAAAKLAARFEAVPGRYSASANYIKNITAVDALPEYADGRITVQGEASMLVVEAAGIREGDAVLDVCAAPGGKTAYAAQFSPSRLLAGELHPHRAELMRKNFERLGVEAKISVADASVPDPALYGCFDRVIIDAPCSALGLLYRKPDIKYSKSADDIDSLISVQGEILETCSRYVRPGGRLIYSTCTIDKRENDGNIDAFLQRHAEYREDDLAALLPSLPKERIRGGRIQLFPHLDGIDGFFIAVLGRVK